MEIIVSRQDDRTARLIGTEGIAQLRAATVALFGLGGVGGHTAEALARAGVGHLILVDFDVIEPTNLNRQSLALTTNLGRKKVEIAQERIAAIHPEVAVTAHPVYVNKENAASLIAGADVVIDAIDHVEAKVDLLKAALSASIYTVSAMGAGCRLDPGAVRVADISQTKGCPLARAVRQRLRACGIIGGIQCVYSEEPPISNRMETSHTYSYVISDVSKDDPIYKSPLGSISYLPGIFGLTLAGLAIRYILDTSDPQEQTVCTD